MRKLILFIHTTFNGVVTGDPSKDKTDFMAWAARSSSREDISYLLKTLDTVDTLLMGRGTYEDLSRKWPGANGSPLGAKINSMHKLVVTGDRPLDELRWGKFAAPEQLTGGDIEKQIKDLKKGTGGDIIIFGSPVLVRSLTGANLIDLYLFKVHPVVVNVGDHLFDGLAKQKNFQLLDVKPLEGGAMLVTYAPAKS